MTQLETAQSLAIRIIVLTRLRLDGEAIAALLQAQPSFRVLSTTTSISVAATIGKHRRPDVVLLDGSLIGQPGSESLASLIRQLGDVPVLVLDEKTNHAHVSTLLNLPCAGYFTRGTPFPELADGIRRMARGIGAFDAGVAERIEQTAGGRRYRLDPSGSVTATLTPREIEVWRLIAHGHSVKRCAELLHLAASTVDNHKSHLMKKLGVHKSLDLTRLAIREGLIAI